LLSIHRFVCYVGGVQLPRVNFLRFYIGRNFPSSKPTQIITIMSLTRSSNNSLSSSLLLLPPVPESASFPSIKAAYHASLVTSLRSITQSSTTAGRRILDIALPCPHLYDQANTPRSALFERTQSVVAKVYKLICIVSAKEGFNVEDAEGIDPRIILLAYPNDGRLNHTTTASLDDNGEGPVIELGTLARCGRSWDMIFAVESEPGEQLLKNFLSLGKPNGEVKMVRAGTSQLSSSSDLSLPVDQQHEARRYQHSAVGGTFDHLHIGHKLLLTMTAFPVDPRRGGEERVITVGITAKDLLAKKKYIEFLEDWHERYKSVHAFLHGIMFFSPAVDRTEKITEVKEPGPNGYAMLVRYPSGLLIRYVEIWDPFGPTITVESIDALVISAETRAGGKAVNQKRKEQGWKELEVFEVDVLDAEEEEEGGSKNSTAEGVQEAFQNKLSSTEIRKMQSERAKERSKV
jgi:phosphopantetheine adenylyltransferase